MSKHIKIRNKKRLQNKLKNLAELKGIRGNVKAAAIHIMGKIKRYPPATAANRPTDERSSWYQRGYGVRYIGGGGRPVSEDLLHRWTVRSINRGLGAVISNNASYAPFVHSEELQAGFHRRRGWKTDKQVLDEEKDYVMKKLQVSVRRELAR